MPVDISTWRPGQNIMAEVGLLGIDTIPLLKPLSATIKTVKKGSKATYRVVKKGGARLRYGLNKKLSASELKESVFTMRGRVPDNVGGIATELSPTKINPLNPSTRFYVSPEGKVLDAKTYARNSGFRTGVRDEAWDGAVDPATGLVRDPLSGTVMNKSDAWDMGHRSGMEYWKERDNAINNWLYNRDYTTRKEFLDKMNDPNRYRPELPSSNRSHRGEDLSNDFWE